MKNFFIKYMGLILIISSICLAGIINLIEIASGNIYQGTYDSNQFNGTVNKEPTRTMVGNNIITSGIDIDISLAEDICDTGEDLNLFDDCMSEFENFKFYF